MIAAALLLATTPFQTKTVEVHFSSHDGHEMFGKLTLPDAPGQYPVVIYVQTAEGMTVDMRRPDGKGGTFDYFDVYRKKLPEMGVGFFSYEGRGVTMGDSPPRYEKIDRAVYDTSSLENKVLDVYSALAAIRSRSDVDRSRMMLMGASEGTLIAAEAAAVVPGIFSALALYGVMSSNMSQTFPYILTDGAFLVYRGYFDTDKDYRISKAEFEADPAKFRANSLGGADFSVFDQDGDGYMTKDELVVLSKPLLDAVEQRNYAVLDQWAKTAAGVATPANWFKDHFEHKPIWTFFTEIDVPVGIFHGDADTSVPVEGVRLMEAKATAAGKKNMEFHYFEGGSHTLGVERYFLNSGTVPAGHQAIFDFVRRQANRGR